jgi:hypothetical protein
MSTSIFGSRMLLTWNLASSLLVGIVFSYALILGVFLLVMMVLFLGSVDHYVDGVWWCEWV